LPLSWNLELLHLIISDSSCLVCFKSETKNTQSIVNIDLGDTKRLSLPEVANQESGGVENCFVEERALNNSLI
jgi:hypothetical protein